MLAPSTARAGVLAGAVWVVASGGSGCNIRPHWAQGATGCVESMWQGWAGGGTFSFLVGVFAFGVWFLSKPFVVWLVFQRAICGFSLPFGVEQVWGFKAAATWVVVWGIAAWIHSVALAIVCIGLVRRGEAGVGVLVGCLLLRVALALMFCDSFGRQLMEPPMGVILNLVKGRLEG